MHPFKWLLIGGLFLASASFQSIAQSVQLPYKEVDVKNVNGTAVFSGTPVSGEPGQPALPSYVVSFLLPPGVDFSP